MPLLEVRHLVKEFGRKGTLLRKASVVRAVDGVSFSIEEGETFGLVGESGSGKSTTGRCLLRLIEPTSGEVRFRGENVLAFNRARMRAARRDMQMVFQDPFSSLNPRMRVGDIVEEPLIIHGIGSKSERRAKVEELFSLVRHICNRVAVMYLGKIVEMGVTERLFVQPQHPYTRALLSAVPITDPAVK